jgi:DNA-binding response OmpR family regulator
MKKEILVLEPDEQQSRNLCDFLTDHDYTTISMNSLVNMDQYIEEKDCRALILNLDNVAVTNKVFRELKKKGRC